MAIYAVGDIQGCAGPFRTLLDNVKFCPSRDQLWLAGDLVNRGVDNVEVLRTVMALGDSAVTVLGNHDLHLLGIAYGARKITSKDTITDVLDAADGEEMIQWLRRQPLLHRSDRYVLSHAGIPHIWTLDQAAGYANEVENIMRGPRIGQFLRKMYSNKPVQWDNALSGNKRLRAIVNYLTRMRFIGTDGLLDFEAKESASHAPPGMRPWFEFDRPEGDGYHRLLFGHWAALEGKTSRDDRIALDTGCIWGGCLTMLRLDDARFFRVDCSRFG